MKLGLMLRYSGATVDFPIDLIKRAEKLAYDSVWPRARTRWRAAALGRGSVRAGRDDPTVADAVPDEFVDEAALVGVTVTDDVA